MTKNLSEEEICISEDLSKHGYDLIKLIGKGGFSYCYLVYSRKFSMNFVCKVITVTDEPGGLINKSFQNEFQALTSVMHPNIIKIYSAFAEANREYLILEYCPFGDLQNYVKKNGPLKSVSEILRYLTMILDALKFLESQHIAHNDIKPANLLIDMHHRIKLTDFGLAQILQSHKTCCEMFAGSLPFLAPEMLAKQCHNPIKTDVWAFGVTLFYLVTSNYPFDSSSIQSLQKTQKYGYYQYNTNVPRFVKEIISRCLQVDPNKRATFSELYDMVKQQVNSFQATKVPSIRPAKSSCQLKKHFIYPLSYRPKDLPSKPLFRTPIHTYHNV